jgi:Ca2+-binding RTX toxin-like protein
MAIFKPTSLLKKGWTFAQNEDLEYYAAQEKDESAIIQTFSTTMVEVYDLEDEVTVRVRGKFSISNKVDDSLNESINSVMDSGVASGTVSEIEFGKITNNKFLSIVKLSELNLTLSEFVDAFYSEPFPILFNGDDEIYGTDFLSEDVDDTGYARDEDGNEFNGNRLHGFAGNDKVYGGKLIDSLWGDRGNDVIYGYDGNDFLFGGVGIDKLYGGDGNDKLNGGTGADTLYGGLGNDTLVGHSGSDRFVFNTQPNSLRNIDTVTDFLSKTDKIVLGKTIFSAIGPSLSTPELVIRSNTNGDGILTFNTVDKKLYYDVDGKGGGDIAICTLVGVARLAVNDFELV